MAMVLVWFWEGFFVVFIFVFCFFKAGFLYIALAVLELVQ